MSDSFRDKSSFYDVLEIATNASPRDIHSAYARAKETYSAGSAALYTMFTTEEARELLKMIEEAFSILSNQSKRADYDLQLARNGHPAFTDLLKKSAQSSYGPATAKASGAERLKSVAPAEPSSKTAKPAGNSTDLPEGFARTRFGIYEVNRVLEHEFALVEECDGSFIQKIRQYKKLTFEQLSESTRISKSYLAALESNAYDALPAPVFVRGFVLQIARTLGVPDRLADAYMKHFRKQIGS